MAPLMKVVHVFSIRCLSVLVHLEIICPFVVVIITQVVTKIWSVGRKIHLGRRLLNVFLLINRSWDHVVVGSVL